MGSYVRPSKDIGSINESYSNALRSGNTDVHIIETDLDIYANALQKCVDSLNALDYSNALIIEGNDLMKEKIDEISGDIQEIKTKINTIKNKFSVAVKEQSKKELSEILDVAKELRGEHSYNASSSTIAMEEIYKAFLNSEESASYYLFESSYGNSYAHQQEVHDNAVKAIEQLNTIIKSIESDLASL